MVGIIATGGSAAGGCECGLVFWVGVVGEEKLASGWGWCGEDEVIDGFWRPKLGVYGKKFGWKVWGTD